MAKSFIVGIAGGSASGKSTFAAALQKALIEGQPPLTVELVNMDRYFLPPEAGAPTFISPSSGQVRVDRNRPDSADNARLVADVLQRSQAEDAPDAILIEGLMALYVPAIRELLDLRLFVDLEADVRALRRMLRGRGRSPNDPLTIEHLIGGINYYRESARVGHALYVQPSIAYADLVIRGDANFARTAAFVADIVRARAGQR
ncbi:MAG: hypothetical protein H5T71_01755 [Chloroflexi bacterium]|nr:hypothetical protein [Chloroflexota bacterium]